MKFASSYEPGEYEPEIYAAWEAEGAFAPKMTSLPVDDDGNGVVDDANAIPWGDTFEPGHEDDLSLVSPDWDDWPAAWQLPNAMFLMVHPIECEAINATNSELDENDYAEDDWANPGKQHQTLNDWR